MGLYKKTGLFCIIFLLFFGCRKSTDANWDVDLVIPVLNSLLNVKNFVSDSLFNSDNNGLLYVTLNREVAAIKLDSLVSIPDTTIDRSFVTPIPLNLTPGQPIVSIAPVELQFQIDKGVKIKRIDIREGSMKVKFTNTAKQPVDLIYEITSATRNGQTLRISETVPTGTASLVKTYDLSGYSLFMRGSSGLKYNTIVQTYTLALSANAAPVTVDPGEGAQVEITYSEMVPDYVEGYFGQQVIKIDQDTASIGLSDNFKASNFMLSDATMDFTILNEFGAEFSGTLSNIKSINTANNNLISLQTNQLSNININRGTRSGSTLVPSVKLISFTPANSNITGFISNLPDKLTYKGSVSLNPLGNVSGYNDFAFYNTGIKVLANINIPLRFTADYFELRSNTEVDFSNVKQLDKVNYGNFTISATNGFPFAVKLQAYMYDAQNTVIDSLFVPGSNIIEAATLNFNNIVVAPVQRKVNISFSKRKVDNLRKCKTIKVVSRFIMPNNPPEIKILEGYEIKINISANMNYNVGLGG